jgi:hypothetical protein
MWADKVEKATVKKASYDERLMDPKAFGGVSSSGKEMNSKEAMFNGQGQLNAYDKKDSVYQLEKFAGLRDRYQHKMKSGSFYSPEEKSKIVDAAFNGDPANRQKFAAAMIPLILERLDYEGFGRQVLMTHEVPQGQIINYEKDVNIAAVVIQEDGQTPEARVKGDRVFPATFQIVANPRIPLNEIYQRQFDIVDRTHDKALFQIMLQEDRAVMKALYAAATIENTSTTITTTVGKTVINALAEMVERHRLLVDKFLMNRAELTDLRNNINIIDFSPEISRDVLLTGIFGQVYGYNIFISAGIDAPNQQNMSVPAGVVMAVTGGNTLGAMPIRMGLQVMPADQYVNNKAEVGFFMVEEIGVAVLNSRAVAVGQKSSCVVPSWML